MGGIPFGRLPKFEGYPMSGRCQEGACARVSGSQVSEAPMEDAFR
jgi:hypothetical protein